MLFSKRDISSLIYSAGQGDTGLPLPRTANQRMANWFSSQPVLAWRKP